MQVRQRYDTALGPRFSLPPRLSDRFMNLLHTQAEKRPRSASLRFNALARHSEMASPSAPLCVINEVANESKSIMN